MKSFVYLSLILMLLAVVGVSSSEKSSEDLFASIFAPPSCARACWYGIEPGVTTEEELLRKLAELNLTYKTRDDTGVKYYGIQQEIYAKPFIEKGFGSPLIHVWDGVVGHLVLPVDIPLNLIGNAWGSPSKIENDGTNIRVIYYNEGIYLHGELYEDTITYIEMARDNILGETYVVPVEEGGPPPMSSCEGVSQAICDFVSPTFIPLLRDTFKSEGCQRACWLGIEPDVTTEQEALDILVANGLIPNEIQELRAASFKMETAFPFIGESFNSGLVRFGYGKVSQIELPTNVTLEQIKSAYGIPDRIIDRDDNSFQIVYASEWMVFETSDANPDQIFKMYITNWRWLTTEYIAQPDFSSLVMDCTQALFLCDLLPNVDAQVLKATFTSASCASTCWLGIEPGITSRAEVEQILASHQINYRVESFGGRLGNANDADTYMWLPQNDGLINNGISEATLFFVNNVAVKIHIPVQIPVSAVTQAYGTADWVTVDSGRTLYDAVYEDEGLVFNLSPSLSPDITHISLEPSAALRDLYMPTRECVLSDPICHQFLDSDDAQALRDMLLPANCAQACFFGMQPEATTRIEFEAFLEQNQIVPYIVTSDDLDNTHYEWDLPGQTVFKPQSGSKGQVIFNQGKIGRITLPLDIPLSVVYEVFGYPDTVTNYDDRLVILIYKELGAAIILKRQSNHTRTLDVILASASSPYESYLVNPPGEIVNQPCSSYGVFPCIAPTATPMPIGDAPLSSDAQALRDMLLSPECTQACFFGLQPEITTRTEFETFLNQNQITSYIVSTDDLDNAQYQYDLPAQTVFKPQSVIKGQVLFNQGKIGRITLSLDIPLSVVYEVFGSPDTVTNYDDRVITFIYKKLGIAIMLSRQSNHTRTLRVLLASASSQYESFLVNPPGKIVNQPCSSYGVFPCIAPTATPMAK